VGRVTVGSTLTAVTAARASPIRFPPDPASRLAQACAAHRIASLAVARVASHEDLPLDPNALLCGPARHTLLAWRRPEASASTRRRFPASRHDFAGALALMPPHASLSSQDGTSTASSVRARDIYYSNEGMRCWRLPPRRRADLVSADISILHEVVRKGEEMLPAMPARDRLPTNALFKAAEIVLPGHGIDPDDDKFANMLFRIGGERKTPGLMDKFSSVLGGMGIELEFVDKIEQGPASSVHSVSGDSTAQSGTFPISPRFNGRRRRNSDSIAPVALDGQPAEPIQKRRASFSSLQQAETELPGTANGARSVDDWLLHRPGIVPGHYPEHDVNGGEDDPTDEQVSIPIRRPVHQLLDGRRHHLPRTADRDVADDLPDYLRGDRRHLGGPPVDIFPYGSSSRQAGLPLNDRAASDGEYAGIDRRSRPAHPRDDTPYDFNDHPRSLAPSPSADTRSNVSQDLELSFSASAASHDAYPQTPGSLHSGLDWDGFRGDSDTTFQDDIDGPSPRYDPAIMAKTADALLIFQSLRGGYSALRVAQLRNRDRHAYAVHMDRELFVSEAVLQWSEEAGTVLRNEATVLQRPDEQTEPDVPEGGRLQNRRDNIMRRAGRAYDLSILHKAFTHWWALAEEEVERTETARRHLLRRKVFGAWCQQNADDQERVSTFTVRYSIRRWSKAAAENEGTSQRVVQVHNDKLSGAACRQWAIAWQQHDANAVAIVGGQDSTLMKDSIGTWQGETALRVEISRQTVEHEYQGLRESTLRDWQKQAAQQRGLRQYGARRKQNLLSAVVEGWRQQTEALQEKEAQLRVQSLQDWAAHWRNEAKLAWHQGFQDDYLKSQAVYEWMLLERAAVLRRYHERRRKHYAFGCLKTTFAGTQTREAQLDEQAVILDKKNILTAFTSTAGDELRDYQSQLEGAQQIATSQLATEVFTTLAEGVISHQDMESLACRGEYYVSTFNALSGWAELAKQTREDRLRATYRQLRRTVKKALASDCMASWTAATDSSLASGWEADAVRSENAKTEVVDTMNHWIAETNDKLIKHGIAVEGYLEVHVSKWRVQAAKYQEAAVEACDHDAYLEMKGSWDAWDLQSVQVRGRHHTAAELADKNNKRTTRQALGLWREAALPGGPEDFRASVGSRQSVRRGMGTWRSAYSGYSTPLGPMSAFDDDRPGPALMSSPLHPITEYSEDQSYGSRFRASQGSHALPEQPSPLPDPDIPTFPGVAVPPYGERLSLPHRFRSAPLYSSTPLGGAPEGTPVLTSSPPRAASAPHDRESEPPRPRPRFGSLQRKLDQAARLAASVQLRPPSDEGDDEDEAPRERAHSGRLPRYHYAAASFPDTPSRPTTAPAAAARATTTPLAPLPSERERQLRYEYAGRGGILLNPTEGRSSTRRESRVSFVGLRGRGFGGGGGGGDADDEGEG